jgi:hypothetical protein
MNNRYGNATDGVAHGGVSVREGKIEVRTPNVPGYAHKVDAAKYRVMRAQLLRTIPRTAPGITAAELVAAVRPALPKGVFGHEAVQWWVKCVQLDLEARGALVRDPAAKPLRWRRTR